MIPVDHFGLESAGRCESWCSTDNEDAWKINNKDPISNKKLQELGWTEQSVTYQYNSHGFRTAEFNQSPCAIALGASVTVGIGVPEQCTWSAVLGQDLGIKIYNLGSAGAAMDTIYRILDHYVSTLNIKLVLLSPPPGARFELLAHHGRFEVYGPAMGMDRHPAFIKEWMYSERNYLLNYEKNLRSIKWILEQKNIKFAMPDMTQELACDGLARDLAHPGIAAHKDFAALMQGHVENDPEWAEIKEGLTCN